MSDIVEAADKFIFQLFKDKLPNTFIYHNYKHSCRVHKSINEIIENSQIDVKDAKILRLAALLHDTGYTVSRENHEEEGVKIATEFLKEHNVEDDIIEGVKKCILATKFKDTVPNSELEKIIRDADTSHLGKDYFEEASEFLRQELQLQNIQKYTAEEWIDLNIKMLLEEHQFYTDYALKNWLPVKEDNLAKLFKDKKRKGKDSKRTRKSEVKSEIQK